MSTNAGPKSSLVSAISVGVHSAAKLNDACRRLIFENAPAQWIDFNLFLVLSVPFILLVANDEWLFAFGNMSDNWHNTVYFYENGFESPPLYDSYKATRLSWIAKGYLIHKLFPPLIAHYVLHLGIFGAYIVVFYLIVRNVTNRHVAVLASIAFGTYSQLHAVESFEWDYQTHDGVVNMLLTLLFLLFAAKGTRWRMWLVLAGAAWASALQTTYMGVFIPATAFWYLYYNHKHVRRPVVRSIGLVVVGGVLATLFYGLVSLALGGPFLFFRNLVTPILSFGFAGWTNFHIGYWFPIEHLLQRRSGLVVPLYATAIAGGLLLVILAKRRSGPALDAIVGLLVSLLIAFAASLAFHFVGHGQLSNDHIIAYMAPFVFLGVAGIYAYLLLTSGISAPTSRLRARTLECVVLLMFCGALVFGLNVHFAANLLARNPVDVSSAGLSWRDPMWRSVDTLSLLLLISVAAVVLIKAFPEYPRARHYIAALGLSAFLATTNVQNTSILVASYDVNYDCGHRKDQHRAVLATFAKLREFDPGHDLRLWYGNRDVALHPEPRCSAGRLPGHYPGSSISLTSAYSAVVGMRFYSLEDSTPEVPDRHPGLVATFLGSYSFADLSDRRVPELPDQFRAAILAQDPADHDLALETLNTHGMQYRILDQSEVRHGVIAYGVTIVEVRKNDRLRARTRL